MKDQHILFIVLNDLKRYKDIKKKLIDLDYKRFTVIDTIGMTGSVDPMQYTKMFYSTLAEIDIKQYNKTIFLVLESDEEVIKVMDEISAILDLEANKPGKGIMFSVPILTSHGVRF
jgi:nitrogen regulatory protein PII